MSLFLCSRCGCIENTNLVNKTYKPTLCHFNGDEKDFHPSLSRMSMDGYDDEDIYLNGKIWKHRSDIMYLCSECNTGTWHDEFEKTMPSERTVILSQFSKAGYITKYDHAECSIIEDDDDVFECGYRPNMQYYYLLKLYRKLINDDSFKGNIIEDLKKRSNLLNPRQSGKTTSTHDLYLSYNNFLLIYDLMVEEGDNFHLTLQGDDDIEDWTDIREICLICLDSVINPNKVKGLYKTIEKSHNLENDMILDAIVKYRFFEKNNTTIKTCTPHWKETQSAEDRDLKLKKAEEKRLRKAQRK